MVVSIGTAGKAIQGALLGLFLACAGGGLLGTAVTMRAMLTRPAGSRAEMFAMALSEGVNCAAFLALVAVPVGTMLALRRRR